MTHSEIRARIARAVKDDELVDSIPHELWDAVRECLKRHNGDDIELVEWILTTTKAPFWLRQQAMDAGYRRYMSLREFAADSCVSYRTLQNHIKAGLPVHLLANNRLLRWVDYEEALQWYAEHGDATAKRKLEQIAESRKIAAMEEKQKDRNG